ncbi:unnamed protein product [Polarella glacialis]|uniref:Uncharacterized protein n=1 Tax=Polarella glacialis TaxID=89957 RepID=A0A813L5C0_POLGL|nr:unnamed protein product [Polarella glacialis]
MHPAYFAFQLISRFRILLVLHWHIFERHISQLGKTCKMRCQQPRPGHLAHWLLPRPAMDSPGTEAYHQASGSAASMRAASSLAPDIWPTGSFLALPGTAQGQKPHARHQAQQSQCELPAASPRISGPLAPSSACQVQPRDRSLTPGIRLNSVNASCQQPRPGHLVHCLNPRPAMDRSLTPGIRLSSVSASCDQPRPPRTSGPLVPSSACQGQPRDSNLTPGIKLNSVSASCQQPRPGHLAHWLLSRPARDSPGTAASHQASGSAVSVPS